MMDVIGRKAAAKEGLTKYYTGKPCAQGHISYRYTTTAACYECCKASTYAGRSSMKQAISDAIAKKQEA